MTTPVRNSKPLRGQGITVYKAKKPGEFVAGVKNGNGKFSTVGTFPSYDQAKRAARRAKRKQGGGLLGRLGRKAVGDTSGLQASIQSLDNAVRELTAVIKAM